MEGKIKVVWLCNFSDEKTRSHIKFSHFYFKNLISYMFLRPAPKRVDYGVWVSNAIKEFENFQDIDLTVIFPYTGIKGKSQFFDINGVHYVCYRTEEDNFIDYIRRKYFGFVKINWDENRKVIKDYISQISPDIIHVIGAENPYYSSAALDIPNNIPSVLSLQTLLSDPNFINKYPMSQRMYDYRSALEREIIKKCNYIASPVVVFNRIIKRQIMQNAVFLNMPLAVGEDIDISFDKKEYDFVYFAANINKACDVAIEAFAIAAKQDGTLTLNVSGLYDTAYKSKIDARINELGIADKVFFSGSQATHDDVLRQIKKSRFALLPLKIDLISGTIREAMACGLPVVTTVTPVTPSLNADRESVLLSELGDYESMANNMLKLVQDQDYATLIMNNGIKTVSERYGNKENMQKWHNGYYEIVDHFKEGKSFSSNLLVK